jgi:hypothetical protein
MRIPGHGRRAERESREAGSGSIALEPTVSGQGIATRAPGGHGAQGGPLRAGCVRPGLACWGALYTPRVLENLKI